MYRVWKNCIGCGECAKACDFNLIQTFDDYILMDIEKCRHCSKCVETFDPFDDAVPKFVYENLG